MLHWEAVNTPLCKVPNGLEPECSINHTHIKYSLSLGFVAKLEEGGEALCVEITLSVLSLKGGVDDVFWNLLYFLRREVLLILGRGLRGAKRIKCNTCQVLHFLFNWPRVEGTSCLCAKFPDLFCTVWFLQTKHRVSLQKIKILQNPQLCFSEVWLLNRRKLP